MTGCLEYKIKEHGLSLMEKWNTDNSLNTTMDYAKLCNGQTGRQLSAKVWQVQDTIWPAGLWSPCPPLFRRRFFHNSKLHLSLNCEWIAWALGRGTGTELGPRRLPCHPLAWLTSSLDEVGHVTPYTVLDAFPLVKHFLSLLGYPPWPVQLDFVPL